MRVQADGFEIAYQDVGQGEPVLLVHGFPLDGRMWGRQMDVLSNSYRLIAPDLRGFGESQPPAEAYSMDAYADDLAMLLSRLDIPKAVLVGFSMGGYIAFAFARRHPQLLSGLILADTKATTDSPAGLEGRRNTIKLAQEQGPRAVAESSAAKMFSPLSLQAKSELLAEAIELESAQPAEAIVAAAQAMIERPDSLETVRQLDVPVLVIVGSDDVLAPPDEARKMAGEACNGTLQVIPGAGHLSNWEQPERWNQVVRTWLRGIKWHE